MKDFANILLTVLDVSRRWGLSARAVRERIKDGRLPAVRRNRDYLIRAGDMWTFEQGRYPRGVVQMRHFRPLLSKRDLGALARASVRTVERWAADGLPTRNVGTNVRFDEQQARIWLRGRFGLELPLPHDEPADNQSLFGTNPKSGT